MVITFKKKKLPMNHCSLVFLAVLLPRMLALKEQQWELELQSPGPSLPLTQ